MSYGKCPKCGYIFTNAETLEKDNRKPRVGDASFCINCGAINMFDKFGVKPARLADFLPETREELAKIRSAWLKIKKRSDIV